MLIAFSSEYNAESGVLAKPRRARLHAIIFVVPLLVKGAAIFCKVRLEYDGL